MTLLEDDESNQREGTTGEVRFLFLSERRVMLEVGKNGAGNGIRTRDIYLGKVELYH